MISTPMLRATSAWLEWARRAGMTTMGDVMPLLPDWPPDEVRPPSSTAAGQRSWDGPPGCLSGRSGPALAVLWNLLVAHMRTAFHREGAPTSHIILLYDFYSGARSPGAIARRAIWLPRSCRRNTLRGG